ncbi:MAG: hypothetical protein HOP21_10900 [Methylotenera sp.]|nr:hypothetical protein [Methylotenera sp.]
MKPVRRRIKRHFGLTARQVAVRSKRPWYFQWGLFIVVATIGYGLAYWQYAAGGGKVREELNKLTLENQALHTKVIEVSQQLQIEKAAQTNLTKELNVVQDENMRIKEDLVFYKNMLNGKK